MPVIAHWSLQMILCGRKNKAPRDVYLLTLKIFEYGLLYEKGDLSLLINWPWDGEIILNYLSEFNLIIESLKVEEGSWRK